MANNLRQVGNLQLPLLVTLASADDLDGTLDGSQYFKVPKGARALIFQADDGTHGTAGIDVIEVNIGSTGFIPAPDLLLLSSADQSGTPVTGAALNAAGVEPVSPNIGAAHWKLGPYAQDAIVRCGRKTTSTAGTTWITGAPSVYALLLKNRRGV